MFAGKLAFHKPIFKNNSYPAVSVIICAKNESENLQKYLPDILTQNYPNFEVLVIDDQSTDITAEILKNLSAQYPNLKYRLSTNYHLLGKRNALLTGIKNAKYDLLLLTDADCQPSSKNWMQKMVEPINDKIKIVLGHAPFFKRNSLLNKLIQYDNYSIAINYLSFALNHIPYMGTGRNMLYDKNLILSNEEIFYKYRKKISGDDDLLIKEIADKTNTAIQTDTDSFMYSAPKDNLKDWIKQKNRHHSTASSYRWYHQILLILFPFSNILFFICLAVLIFSPHLTIAIIFYLLRTILQLFIHQPLSKKLDFKQLWLFIPLFDFFSFIFYFIFIPGLFKRPDHLWK